MVTDVEPGSRGKHVTVEFPLASGERVSAWCDSCDDGLRQGDQVRIRYDPTDPDQLVEQVGRTSRRNVSRFSWFAAATRTAGMIAIMVARWRRRRDRNSTSYGSSTSQP
ncbi:DUF3592 domain-containing protein [Catellatospora sichuanensis]|uniref:DUF3592 domain-containing protein n=1 Tax=Catellatospora sichuanensis TaxID=1969805 RepID=UPI001642D08C